MQLLPPAKQKEQKMMMSSNSIAATTSTLTFMFCNATVSIRNQLRCC